MTQHKMKRNIITLLATIALFSACVDFDDATQAVSVRVKVLMPSGLENADMAGHTVTLSLDAQKITATTDAEGIATFQQIVPDVYNISTSWKMSADEYKALTGADIENSTYTISGSLNSQMLSSSSADVITVSTSIKRDQSIIISKVYYAGSKDVNNRNYLAGKFVELYNNSDQEVDVSGLYLALMESESTIAYSPGQVADTIFAKQVFRIPTTKSTTMAPGGTLLLVNSAIDHTVNGENEYNLLNADFEAKDASGRTTNNADVPALDLAYSTYTSLSYMNLVQGGPTSMVIFTTDEDIDSWPNVYAFGKTKGSMFKSIPTRCVIDGVEILKNSTQTGVDINTKRLYDYIDAGYAFINAATGYNGEVICRKTESVTSDGRIILVDTNNSLNDFTASTGISPRHYN